MENEKRQNKAWTLRKKAQERLVPKHQMKGFQERSPWLQGLGGGRQVTGSQ